MMVHIIKYGKMQSKPSKEAIVDNKKWSLDWLEFVLVGLLVFIVTLVTVILMGEAFGEMIHDFIGWLING